MIKMFVLQNTSMKKLKDKQQTWRKYFANSSFDKALYPAYTTNTYNSVRQKSNKKMCKRV